MDFEETQRNLKNNSIFVKCKPVIFYEKAEAAAPPTVTFLLNEITKIKIDTGLAPKIGNKARRFGDDMVLLQILNS
jgi:hypothetical protein